MNNVLYVYGGENNDDRLYSSIERLVDANCRVGETFGSWETLQITTAGFTSPLMMPFNSQ